MAFPIHVHVIYYPCCDITYHESAHVYIITTYNLASFPGSPRVRTKSGKERGEPEEVGHAYRPTWNSVSRMVSKHCKINMETALKVRFVLVLSRALDPVGAPYSVGG